MTWYDIISTLTKLTELDGFTVEDCENILECKFEKTDSNRLRANNLVAPFDYAGLIPDNEGMTLTLFFKPDAAREEYVLRMAALGKPIDIEIVSPPMDNGNAPKTNLGWDRKFSLCYEYGEQKVWFGIEEAKSQKKLVSITLKQ